MAQTFFFYDLETSSLNSRFGRIMQFAGIRTDMNLETISEPINLLVKMSDDTLPDPAAIMVTGITPQATLTDGLNEPEFCRYIQEEIFTPDTTIVGFNNVRFDDEFIRHTFWRNFYDPYEWSWSEGRSRWDLLDVVRMVRALRPDGIRWPFDSEGKAVNKLEPIAKENELLHTKAHDALSDVEALIQVAKLVRDKQPKMFEYLLGIRDKKKVAALVSLDDPRPFVYCSGRYDVKYEKTTLAFPIAPGTKPGSVLVYDLREDPTPFLQATPQALAEVMFSKKTQDAPRLPVKEISLNRCPAVAPESVLRDEDRERLHLEKELIARHLKLLLSNPAFGDAVRTAFEMREPYEPQTDPEAQLYDGFLNDKDKPRMAAVRNANPEQLADFHPDFADERLSELLLRYKGRWYSGSLSDDERVAWENYRSRKLRAQLPVYMDMLVKLSHTTADTFVLEELQLWAESIAPIE